MADFFDIHPTHPQERYIARVVAALSKGAVMAYPTDSGYALGCHLNDKGALERIIRIRQLGPKHLFTLMCQNISELAIYAQVDNPSFRLLKAHTPGAYTFILEATKQVPKRVQPLKRKTIGVRIPDYPIVLSLLEAHGEPILSTSLILPEEETPLSDPYEILQTLGSSVDLIIDAGENRQERTSIIDLTGINPVIIREGSGDVSGFSV
jgi:tRNA threonylcarbamoyl adenosine modification protein (Sua5/YciO/YrdC/YwlC family)